eukprot:11489553-Prorocentrum_lima.AAC.1
MWHIEEYRGITLSQYTKSAHASESEVQHEIKSKGDLLDAKELQGKAQNKASTSFQQVEDRLASSQRADPESIPDSMVEGVLHIGE